MSERMLKGLFLGYHKSWNSYRVMDDDGNMHKTRALQRRPIEER